MDASTASKPTSEPAQSTENCLKYPEYGPHLQPLIAMEFEKAPTYESKKIIHQRVWKNVGEHLGICNQNLSNVKSNFVYIHPDVLSMIHDIHNSFIESDVKCDPLSYYFNIFISSDYQDPIKVRNFLKELIKRNEINKDHTNKKEKVFKDNTLTTLLAMDGLLGHQVTDGQNYISNFGVGRVATKKYEHHVVAVRKMLQHIPCIINGTNSVHLVLMVLLQLYKPFIQDRDVLALIEQSITESKDFLIKQSSHYKAINDAMKPEFIKKLSHIYSKHVNCSEMAHDKIEVFKNTLKKKSNNRLSKKRKSDDEEGPSEKNNTV